MKDIQMQKVIERENFRCLCSSYKQLKNNIINSMGMWENSIGYGFVICRISDMIRSIHQNF